MNFFSGYLIPKFKTITPVQASRPVRDKYKVTSVHDYIAEAINLFFKTVLSKQLFMANGAVTSAGGVTVPLITLCGKPTKFDIGMSRELVYKSFSTKEVEKRGFPALFENIGKCITTNINTFTGAPVINGIGSTVIDTSHYIIHAQNLLKSFSLLSPEKDNIKHEPNEKITEEIWDLFETHLLAAITATPPSTVIPFTGAAPGGIFNGVMNVKLIA